jgi:hypothetical protein
VRGDDDRPDIIDMSTHHDDHYTTMATWRRGAALTPPVDRRQSGNAEDRRPAGRH